MQSNACSMHMQSSGVVDYMQHSASVGHCKLLHSCGYVIQSEAQLELQQVLVMKMMMKMILKLTWQLMKITDMPLTAPHPHSPNFVQTDHITIAWWPASQFHKLPKVSPQP